MATLAEIAQSAGVSIPTVSRVLNGKRKAARISEKRAAEIFLLAQQMGYRPNAAARSTRSGRFNSVALLLSTNYAHSSVPSGLLGGIHDGLAAHDQHLLLARVHDETLTSNQKMPRLVREWNCDGLLINYTENIPPTTLELIERYRLPAVWVNTRLPHDCVHPDDEGGAYAATRHLIELGHRRIAYFGQPILPGKTESDIHYSAFDRQAGYERAMADAGLEPRVLDYQKEESAHEDASVNLALRTLAGSDRPTAILAYSGGAALAVAALRLGLSVPRDLSFITFENRPARFPGLRIATVVVDFYAVGRVAADMIVRKIATPGTALSARSVPLQIMAGESTAPPPDPNVSRS